MTPSSVSDKKTVRRKLEHDFVIKEMDKILDGCGFGRMEIVFKDNTVVTVRPAPDLRVTE